MTLHSWTITAVTESVGFPSTRKTVHWFCNRCSCRTLLYEGFHPLTVGPKIVAAGDDCDLALVRTVMDD